MATITSYDFEHVHGTLDHADHYAQVTDTPWYHDAVYKTFSTAEYARRHALLREKMLEHRVDCVIAPGGGNNWGFGTAVVWLAGLRLRESALAQYVVFPLEGEPTLICGYAGPFLEAVRRSVVIDDVRPSEDGQFGKVIADRLAELGHHKSRIGLLESSPGRNFDVMPYNHLQTLRERLPQAKFELLKGLYHELLHVKSAEEIAVIEQAGRLLDQAYEAMCQTARPGVTEAEIMAAAGEAIVSGGGTTGLLIIGSTPSHNPALPFGNTRPSRRVLQSGDIIVNELSAGVLGYTAQFGQPICVGEPDPAVRRFWEEVVQPGFNLLAEYMRPGATAAELQQAGRWYNDHGCQGRPLLLHGMDITTSRPRIGRERIIAYDFERTFKPGMTLMLEPDAITADGLLGLFVGRTYVITETGGYSVSKTPVELTVV
jgi:Xaa-Pro aminopeptidase